MEGNAIKEKATAPKEEGQRRAGWEQPAGLRVNELQLPEQSRAFDPQCALNEAVAWGIQLPVGAG